MFFDWISAGIETHGRLSGQIKTVCPNCSAERKKKRDKCLSVNLSEGTYMCHHCQWSGTVATGKREREEHWQRPAKSYRRPDYAPSTAAPTDPLLEWFKGRGISAETVKRYQIELRKAWMPQTGKDEGTIAFPYFRDGQVVNVKYRTRAKDFRMEKDAELCLYGLDDIEDWETLIFVEGELDKLALAEAGYPNCVSVPNGADTNLDCLAADEARLEHIKKFIIAVDDDPKGKKLEASLISRLGRDRCAVVEWPFACKDANDVLIQHGAEKLQEAIDRAKPIPIEGVFEIDDVRERVKNLYRHGTPTGVNPGWNNLNELYRPRLGAWTVVISIPKSGKTSWMAALMINLAIQHDWRFAVFPAENLPAEEYISLLTEIYLGKPFNHGPSTRMTEAELDRALDWLQDHFVILNPDEDNRSLDSLLATAKAYCLRRGIQGFVIDPWNELEHCQPIGVTETQYIGKSLIKIRRFAKVHNIHIWVVVHPAKMQKDKNGQYPIPTLYDAAGSAHWRNKCDYGLSIYRHFDEPERPTEIHVQAIRWKGTGDVGKAELYFDRISGRYSETPTAWGLPTYTDKRYETERDSEDWRVDV